jgi:hypothetical protein
MSEFNETMLSKISFVESKNDIKLDFYDSSNGSDLDSVYCKTVYAFNYHTSLEADEECLPCFVLDVSIAKLDKDEIDRSFEKFNFKFNFCDGPAVPKSDEYYLLKIEGGPIYISIICNRIDIIKP